MYHQPAMPTQATVTEAIEFAGCGAPILIDYGFAQLPDTGYIDTTVQPYAGAGFTELCEICGSEVDADHLNDDGICDECHYYG